MYWQADPAAPSRPRTVRLALPSGPVDLEADAGVFSKRGVDPGTAVLLRVAPEPPATGSLLDLGCGYGPIAVSLASRAPGATVWAVDVNARALLLASGNAERLGLRNMRTATPEAVPADVRFAAIYANPPVKIGKTPMRELVASWLARLEPGGHAYLVVKRSMGSDTFAAWLAGEGLAVRRLGSKQGYRVLQVDA
jgi:16S rRNA (guanine1207-N2)-methyltransferase